MWVINYVIERPLKAVLPSRLQLNSLESLKLNNKYQSLFAHEEMVVHLLATYAADEVFTETFSDIQ